MDTHRKKLLISRILSGIISFKFNGKRYSLRHPSLETLQRADELYYQTLDECKFDTWLKSENIDKVLLQQGVLSLCTDERIGRLEELLENCRVELYENFFKGQQAVKRCRQQITNVVKQFERAIQYKHSLNHWTIHGYAANIKNQYIVKQTLYLNNCRVYPGNMDFKNKNVSYHLLEMGTVTKIQTYTSNKDLRYLARNEPWQSLWNTGKPNPFQWHILELNDEQKLLLTFSRMYDNIYSGLDSPPEEVIKDDDALDGWLAVQRRKREKEKVGKDVQDSLSVKQQGAAEVFLPVSNKKDAQKINQLNTVQGQMVKQQRARLIKQKGKVVETEFMDKRLEVQMESNKQFKEHMKK